MTYSEKLKERVFASSTQIEDLWTDCDDWDFPVRVVARLKVGVSPTYSAASWVVLISTALQMGITVDWWIVPFDFATADDPVVVGRLTEWQESAGIAVPVNFSIPTPPFLRSPNLIRL